jgi:pyruvate,water dikinase
LPVLDGVVLLPGEDEGDLLSRLASLGPGPYAVRSSSALEDSEGASAAGLYLSVSGVPAAEVPGAAQRVRASAEGAEVIAYLGGRGLRPRPIAVLVQPDARAATLGIARSAAGGFLVEERPAGTPEWGDASASQLARDANDPLATLLRRTEDLLGGPVDVEFARAAHALMLLQARPVAPAPAPTRLAILPPGRWRLDAEHNPDPISAAQASLVELVDGPRFGPRVRVIGGYLYLREDAPPVERAAPLGEDVRRRFEIEGSALYAELVASEGAPLPAVLSTYVRVLRRYAELRPALGVARAALDRVLGELGESLWSLPRLLSGVGGAGAERDAALYALGRAPSAEALDDYLARFGMYAPAWDVRVACDAEEPQRLLATARRRALGPSPEALATAARALGDNAAAGVRRRLSVEARPRFDEALARLRVLVELGEDDDVLFYEGQWVVRRALLERGRTLVEAGRLVRVEDIFELPLRVSVYGEGALRALAEAGRAVRLAAARVVPPHRIVDSQPQVRLPSSAEVLRGRGVGGRGRGPAHVLTALGPIENVPDGAVLVVATALPSLAPHLPRLAGLVTEHGGALSHAATLAREAGLPAVVGVAGALQIPEGTPIYVDGDRGRVLMLGNRAWVSGQR